VAGGGGERPAVHPGRLPHRPGPDGSATRPDLFEQSGAGRDHSPARDPGGRPRVARRAAIPDRQPDSGLRAAFGPAVVLADGVALAIKLGFAVDIGVVVDIGLAIKLAVDIDIAQVVDIDIDIAHVVALAHVVVLAHVVALAYDIAVVVPITDGLRPMDLS
jgi:hypothetical protein